MEETEQERREREEYNREELGIGLPLEPGDKEWEAAHKNKVVVPKRPAAWRKPNPWWRLEIDEGDHCRLDEQGLDNIDGDE